MFALNIDDLTKDFYNKQHFYSRFLQKKQILKQCNLSIKQGEIFGLAGLNGIGKTTLIKIILDMICPTSGAIQIFGKKNTLPEARKSICYLPEKFTPSQYLTGYEFLKLSLCFYEKKIHNKTIETIAKNLDFDPACLKYVIKKYSKGMQQKLGLLYCLLSDAKLLILDEPMTGLDPKVRFLLKKSLKDYVKNGNTIFFSSHILDDIEEICDNMAILHNGNICFLGSPQQLRQEYPAINAEKSFLQCIEK